MSAPDAIQRVSEAAATIIDADSAVQAITGRSSNNIVRYGRRSLDLPRPIIAYLADSAAIRGGVGENYTVSLILRAEAEKAADVNALLRAAITALTTTALFANGADALVESWELTNLPDDSTNDPASTNPTLVAGEATLSVWITL
jgi:hypothetical protein